MLELQREQIIIAGVQIRFYGIIIVIGLIVAAWVATRLAKRVKLNPDHVWGGLVWAIIPGIIGARLWFVLFPPVSLTVGCAEGVDGPCITFQWFMENITNLNNGPLAIWSGGLSIFGAVLGGLFGAYLYARRHKLYMPVWLDIAGVAIPIGQTIGRFANFVNQELYGAATTLPWGITIESQHRVGIYKSMVEYPPDTLFHPIFLYEALWSFAAFWILRYIFLHHRHRLYPGDIFLLYLMQYSVIRFLLEFLRVEIAVVPGTSINSSQLMTGLLFLFALLVLLFRHRPGANYRSWNEVESNATA